MVYQESETENSLPHKPFIISKAVYLALSPLDQLAAKALEKVGDVKIVEQDDLPVHG